MAQFRVCAQSARRNVGATTLRRWPATRWVNTLLIVGVACGGVLLFLLASATTNSQRFEQHYNVLLALNGLTAVALLSWVVFLSMRLIRHVRRRRFGARLTARLALAFALVGVVPGVVVYLLSVQFLSRSIESWFNVRVDSALQAGLTLGRSALDSLLFELNGKALSLANGMSGQPDAVLPAMLSALRERSGAAEALIFTANGRVIASAGQRLGVWLPELPPVTVMQQLRFSHGYLAAEGGSLADDDTVSTLRRADEPLQLRAIVPIAPGLSFNLGSSGGSETRYLQLLQAVPEQVSQHALAVQTGYRDYQSLALSRSGLRKLYGVTLTLALLLAVLGAVAAAFALSTRLVRPLLLLAQGTQAVGGGDFRPIPESTRRDEIHTLTRSFNNMTRQLEEARQLVDANRQALEKSNAYLESVLRSLSSGVMVLDSDFRLVSANEGASLILRTDLAQLTGLALRDQPDLAPLAEVFESAFAAPAVTTAPERFWQRQIELRRPSDTAAIDETLGDPTIVLLARGSRLPGGAHHTLEAPHARDGFVIVFDDITELISAHRSAAWGEVARRLAHEIKNPLTPIQLSAERLERKLTERLSETDAEFLRRGTTTIVNQVASMKRMVDDFSEYARSPSPVLEVVDLNALIQELLMLYGWDARDGISRGAHHPVSLEVVLAPDAPQLWGDTTQLRQVLHNLLSNAHDAVEEVAEPRIWLSTTAVPAVGSGAPRQQALRLVLSDNGSGFSPGLLKRAFEPYMTTKPRGTGLGLPIVKKIIDEHGARIELSNRPEGGATVSLIFTRLAEVHEGSEYRSATV